MQQDLLYVLVHPDTNEISETFRDVDLSASMQTKYGSQWKIAQIIPIDTICATCNKYVNSKDLFCKYCGKSL